jgi:hypothetical protein
MICEISRYKSPFSFFTKSIRKVLRVRYSLLLSLCPASEERATNRCFNVVIVFFNGHIESRIFDRKVSERIFLDAGFPITSKPVRLGHPGGRNLQSSEPPYLSADKGRYENRIPHVREWCERRTSST